MAVLPLAMSCGDPAGVGPEIAMRAWLKSQERANTIAAFGLFGDIDQLQKARSIAFAKCSHGRSSS